MAKHARPWAPLALALTILPLCLVACQAPESAIPQGKIRALALSTPTGSPTSSAPTLPPLTIGVWTSTDTPTPPAGDKASAPASVSVTINILCMLQDPARRAVIGPATGLQLLVRLTGPITQSFTEKTNSDGIAQVRAAFTDPRPDALVTIDVSTTWQGVKYEGKTFLIPNDAADASPSPSPSVSPSPASPTPSGSDPTPTTAPAPTATTPPSPTDTPEPTATTDPAITPAAGQ